MSLSLVQQDRLIRRQWPFRTVLLGEHFGLWRGTVFGLSAPYEISIMYVRHHFQPGFEYAYPFFPQVLVHAPLITRRAEAPDDPIPHVFDEGRTEYPSLCLFDPAERGWDSSRAIAATTIPWAADWLRFYEAWQATGVWTGGGRDHFIPGPDDPGDPVGTPTIAADNRAARLIGTSASRALLARATAGMDAVDPLNRLQWADVPGTNWARRAIRSALPFVHDRRIAA
jgi:hypothetical protein